MLDILREPWPWYVGGPVIGLIVPMLLIIGGKTFGISSSMRHICAACGMGNVRFFNYDWKKEGSWNLLFVVGTIIGGFLAGDLLANPKPVSISRQTVADLKNLGIHSFKGLVPAGIFSWSHMLNPVSLVVMIAGGFCIGFGARYAGGCTSGHAISGLSNLQFASLMAVIGFFIGGLLMTYVLLPYILAL